MTASPEPPAAIEPAVVDEPPETTTETPGNAPPRGSTTGDGDRDGGEATNDAAAATEDGKATDSADAPSGGGDVGPPSDAQPPPPVGTNSVVPEPAGNATPMESQRHAEEAAHRAFSAEASRISRSADPDLPALGILLGVSQSKTALYVAHAQASDASTFRDSNDEPNAHDPSILFTLNCEVACHSVLWASEAAVDGGHGEWTHGKVLTVFDDGST